MVEENTTQEFRLTNIDKTRNIFVEEKEQSELWVKSTRKFVEL